MSRIFFLGKKGFVHSLNFGLDPPYVCFKFILSGQLSGSHETRNVLSHFQLFPFIFTSGKYKKLSKRFLLFYYEPKNILLDLFSAKDARRAFQFLMKKPQKSWAIVLKLARNLFGISSSGEKLEA